MFRKLFGKTQEFQNKKLEKKFKEQLIHQYNINYINERLDGFKNWKIYYQFILKESQLKSSNLVLDAGCSMGIYEILFEREGISTENFVGIDLSDKSILTITRHKDKFNVKAKFCIADLERLNFSENTFDRIFCFNTLHHFPEKSLDNVIREFHRVVKPNGKVLIIDANLLNIVILKSHLFEPWSKNEFPYTPFTLKRKFKRVFDRVELKTFRYLPKKDLDFVFDKLPIIKYLGKEVVIIAIKA